jgi:hypothetical protein
LKINPKAAWSLYCRGVAKSRTGKGQDGTSEMTAAVAQDLHAADRAKRYGVE